MEITSDTTRIGLVAFQLEVEAKVWWNWAKTSRDLEAMTWAEFPGAVHGQVCNTPKYTLVVFDMFRYK